MATKSQKERVYLACRAIFSGQKALIRKDKYVRKEIHDHESALYSLKDLGTGKVIEIARHLLERKVFESDIKARREFPSLFQSTADRVALRETSELEAAESVRESLENGVSQGESDDEDHGVFGLFQHVNGNANLMNGGLTTTYRPASSAIPPQPVSSVIPPQPVSSVIPSLHPVRLPYKVQHFVLTKVQELLEECFYDFACQWLPDILEREGCDCAVAIELNHWSHIIRKNYEQIPAAAVHFKISNADFKATLQSIQKLRHSAVHRLKLAGSDCQKFIESAVTMSSVLKDRKRSTLLEGISAELNNKISSMELMKNDAEKTAVAKLEEIKRKREELDREERATIADMLEQDTQNTASIGMLIQESVADLLNAPYWLGDTLGGEGRAMEADEDEVEGELEEEMEFQDSLEEVQEDLPIAVQIYDHQNLEYLRHVDSIVAPDNERGN